MTLAATRVSAMKSYGFIDPGGSQEPPAIAPGVAVRASMETIMEDKIAFSPEEVASQTGLGRTFIFAEIKRGNLVARKAGARTVITAEDVKSWLNDLPKRQPQRIEKFRKGPEQRDASNSVLNPSPVILIPFTEIAKRLGVTPVTARTICARYAVPITRLSPSKHYLTIEDYELLLERAKG